MCSGNVKRLLWDFSPVQVRHDSFTDVAAGLLENPHDFGRSGRIPTRVDDDRAAQLSLRVGRGLQHLNLTLRDGPAGADLANHTTADVCAIGAVKHLADNDICELSERKRVKEEHHRYSDKQLTCLSNSDIF